MRKYIAIAILLITHLSYNAKAQSFYSGEEYGVALGGAQYFGDLNEDYGFKYVRPAFGVFMRFHMNPFIAVRLGAAYTKVGYDDKFSSNIYNKTRNLNFRSDIVEAAVQAEFNFFRFFTGNEKGRFTPYLTGGAGIFYYNPYTIYQGRRQYLRPLGTEGQNVGLGKTYNKISMCFPVGAGIKYWIKPGVNLGFEIANRLTLTDYMDDVSTSYAGAQNFESDPAYPSPAFALQDRSLEVSNVALGRQGKQRGNSASKDQYMTFMVTLSFQLKVYKCPSYIKENYYMY